MVEADPDPKKKASSTSRKNRLEPDERYLGLSKHEVALRKRMAQKFGRDVTHLNPDAQ